MIPQTVAFDEGANPLPLPDFEYYVVGPRTTLAAAKAITDSGSKLIIKIQPVRWIIGGQPYMDAQWDRTISIVPTLPPEISLNLPGEGMDGSRILDFATPQAQNLAIPLVTHCRERGAMGVLFDYGCKDVGWVAPSYDWSGWGAGWGTFRNRIQTTSSLRVWNACNRKQSFGGMLMFENIQASGSDVLYPPNYKQVRTNGGPGSMLLIQNDDARHRVIICGMALEMKALVNYRPRFFEADGRWVNEIPKEMVL